MEVYHHPKIEKKNFKEYFLEFLMIFLAVTMAFIGENMREQLSDVRYKWKFNNFCVTQCSRQWPNQYLYLYKIVSSLK